jgi:hypothetical protein
LAKRPESREQQHCYAETDCEHQRTNAQDTGTLRW